MNSVKCWNKFLAKLDQFNTLPEASWTHYQLLGYFISKTNSTINPIISNEEDTGYGTSAHGTEPNSHPDAESIRYIFRQFNKNGQQTKEFLDWCIEKYGSKLRTAKLRYLLNNYNLQEVEQIKIERCTPLPNNILNAFKLTQYKITTYGDLANLNNASDLKVFATEILKSINLDINKLGLNKII